MRLSPLEKGDVLYLVAPSSPVDEERLVRGVRLFEEAGFKVEHSPALLSRSGYLAGTDEVRLEDINAFLSRREGKAVMMARGGYGVLRILDGVDFSALREKPKVLVGYSDASALLAFVSSRLKIPTVHGCMPATYQIQQRERCHFDLLIDVLSGSITYPRTFFAPLEGMANPREAEGEVLGGCLSVIVSLLGTPFEPDFDRKILVLEEVQERAYRVDRKITHLRISGKLARLSALVLGRLVPVKGESEELLEGIVASVCEREGVPVFRGAPVGHEGENVPFPLGVKGRVRREGDAYAFDILTSPFEVEW